MELSGMDIDEQQRAAEIFCKVFVLQFACAWPPYLHLYECYMNTDMLRATQQRSYRSHS